jgi:cell division protein FtsI/penicillin-binding protein 2
MDPKTGDILALASTPRLDLNQYWRYSEVYPDKTPFNRGTSKSFEPGSVFKVFTMATALDSGTVKPDTTFTDTGVYKIGGLTIHNWDNGAWGTQNMIGCLQHSLNVCLAWVGDKTGADTFYSYMEAFGFGQFTGIDIAGEASGRVKEPGDEDWFPGDLGTNTFGQGISVTPIQIVQAASAIANGGKMMVPHIVSAIADNGNQFEIHPQVAGQPISKETADRLMEMLAVSLEEEASDALVYGYRVAGKTGTGEIPTEYGYTSNKTNASFLGFGPVDDPRFIVFIWLEEPQTIWGSLTAAPTFSELTQRLVVLMDLPPDKVRLGLYAQ